MAITHAASKASGSKGTAAEWNADHVVDDDSKPKNNTTLIVAASDSLDTTRADYVCDGIDDQVEILAAIAALPVQGGRISLLEGNFQITGTVQVSIDDVTIEGTGRSTVLSSALNSHIIQGSTVTGLLIHNLRIVGSGAGVNQHGIRFSAVTDGTIERVWIEDMGGKGIYLRLATVGCVVSSTFVTNCASSGLEISTNANHNVLAGCTITANLGVGIRIIGVSNIVTGCVATGGTQTGLYMTGQKNTVTGCEFTLNGVHGAECWASENIIEGCTCSENVRHGIFVNNAHDYVVVGNVCLRNDQGATGNDGISLISTDYSIIASNRCAENARWEINLQNAACDKNLVHGNHCFGVVHVGAIQDLGVGTTVADNVVA